MEREVLCARSGLHLPLDLRDQIISETLLLKKKALTHPPRLAPIMRRFGDRLQHLEGSEYQDAERGPIEDGYEVSRTAEDVQVNGLTMISMGHQPLDQTLPVRMSSFISQGGSFVEVIKKEDLKVEILYIPEVSQDEMVRTYSGILHPGDWGL